MDLVWCYKAQFAMLMFVFVPLCKLMAPPSSLVKRANSLTGYYGLYLTVLNNDSEKGLSLLTLGLLILRKY